MPGYPSYSLSQKCNGAKTTSNMLAKTILLEELTIDKLPNYNSAEIHFLQEFIFLVHLSLRGF